METVYIPSEDALLDLLKRIQATLAKTIDHLDIKSIPKWEVRYLLWSAVSVNQTTDGYIVLREAKRDYASKMLVRPILETILAAQAVLKKHGFLFRKLYTELQDDLKFHKTATAAQKQKEIDDFTDAYKRSNPSHSIEHKRVSVDFTAQVAQMTDHYEVVYRAYCKFTHGTQAAVTGQLNYATDSLDTRFVIDFCLMALGLLAKHAAANVPELQDFHEAAKALGTMPTPT